MIHPSKALIKEWLYKANGDYEVTLSLNKSKKKKKFYYIIAFHCQQAVEKYLKALLLCYKIIFPKTHDLVELLDLLELKDSFLAGLTNKFRLLNPYAVGFRYPGEDITQEELKDVIKTTKILVKILLKRLKEFL